MSTALDKHWLHSVGQDTAIILPTRGLLTGLNEELASTMIAGGRVVWETPNLFVWSDFLKLLWLGNREKLPESVSRRTPVTPPQSLLLWTQVIEASRRKEQELTLLNVQQTAKAAQRSWRLMNDWRIKLEQIKLDHVADIEQFLLWLDDYQALLAKRNLIDDASILTSLGSLANLDLEFTQLRWHSYDLITDAQAQLNRILEQSGTQISIDSSSVTPRNIDYVLATDAANEIRDCLVAARRELERNPEHRINVVVPDLSQRLPQVREIAREVFYPSASPMQVQQNKTVYRFSLGEPLAQWAAVETALSLLSLLGNHCTVVDFSYLLRNQFTRLASEHSLACDRFDQWLKQQRMRSILFDQVADLYQRCLSDAETQDSSDFLILLRKLVEFRQQVQEKLKQARQSNGFAALSFGDWATEFQAWLDVWGWQTKSANMELNTVQHQLGERWAKLFEEFAAFSAVQKQAGLKRALELIKQLARDSMFLPKAVSSPILISSLLEAIGRKADSCFLTGMHQGFPPPPKNDAFIPARLLQGTGNPEASAQSSYQQAEKVVQSLLSTADTVRISYALMSEQDRELHNEVSPLFRSHFFTQHQQATRPAAKVPLENYVDVLGSPWPPNEATRGGSKIFENQSNCAFKAYATHQLGFEKADEAEFGLDALDRGNVVHHLLDLLWEQLGAQSTLTQKSETELDTLISSVIEQTLSDASLLPNDDKFQLLQHEQPRLKRLLKTWLDFEAKRPQNFSVIEREESRYGEFAGIKFKYIIDRLDMTDDGATFIVDYKTGMINRNDWLGERISRPQMPLYAVALDREKRKPVSGIAYAKVDQQQPEFVELAEANVFRSNSTSKRYAELWQENRQQWESIFTDLAEQFLAGDAQVNPIDENTCAYCDLHAVCRVSQLRRATEQGGVHD